MWVWGAMGWEGYSAHGVGVGSSGGCGKDWLCGVYIGAEYTFSRLRRDYNWVGKGGGWDVDRSTAGWEAGYIRCYRLGYIGVYRS